VLAVRSAAIVGLWLLASPGLAVAGSLNAASTAKFLSVESRIERTVIRLREKLEVSADALIDHVESGCPGALPARLETGSKAQQRTWAAFLEEAADEIAVAELSPVRPAVRRGLARIAPLRWTSTALNSRVGAYVSGGRTALSLHAPDICQQTRTAARLSFTVVPARTSAFDARFESTQPGSSAVALAREMKPLATPDELAGIKQLGHLQSRVDRLLAGFTLQVWDRLTRALTGVSVPGTEL
jgi:hypothetical protein